MAGTYREDNRRRPLYLGTKNAVLCLEQTTGETLWETRLPDASRLYQGLVTLLLHRQHLFAAGARCLALLEPETGRIVWSTELKKLVPPVVLALDEAVPGGLLLAFGAGRAFGLSARSGALTWQNELPGLGYLPITVRAPHALVAHPRPYFVQKGKAVVVSQLGNEQDEPADGSAPR